MEPPIVLRLTLEHMQWQIMQAIYPREVELKTAIEQAVARAVESVDFQAEIERQVATTLHNEIRRRVEIAVLGALRYAAMPELEQRIQAEVEKQLREAKGKP